MTQNDQQSLAYLIQSLSNEFTKKFNQDSREFNSSCNKHKSISFGHLTTIQASKLKINDKIDYRDINGKYRLATVIAKKGTNLKIHYDGLSNNNDEFCDYQIAIHRIAKARSISQRPVHCFEELKNGEYLDINPTKSMPVHPSRYFAATLFNTMDELRDNLCINIRDPNKFTFTNFGDESLEPISYSIDRGKTLKFL